MATVRVLRKFWDLRALCNRERGDVFAAGDDRARELESVLPQHVSVTYDAHEEPVEAPRPDYSKMTNAQLAALCRELGIVLPSKKPTKAKLLELLGG